MLRAIRRRSALAFLAAYEWVLGLVGKTPDYGILSLEISGVLAEGVPEGPFPPWLRRPPRDYISLIALLRWARDDERLRGVIIRCDTIDASWARIQGLRRSVTALRKSGKKVWFHLDSPGLSEYYLAASGDRISVSPSATLDIVGMTLESMFFLDALERFGVRAEVVQMGSYKSAGESFTRRDMSTEHREMMESLIDDLFGQVVCDIAVDRDLDSERVRGIVDSGPFLARESLEHGLIDAVEYVDQAEAALVELLDDAAVIEEADYAVRRSRFVRRQILRSAPHSVAVVHVDGAIRVDEGGASMAGARGASAVSLKSCLKEVREDDELEAVLLRVTSPGGSGLASDLIWHELRRTAEVKPLIVSFGDVAASGGYYVAMAGQKVFAEAGSVTGSIGVVAGKADLKGLYDKVGVQKEIISRGKHAALYSDYAPLGDEERECIRTEAQAFYDDFVGKVADGRRMSTEEADAAARGRVWTGRQAWSRGLVDELGGFEEAFEETKRVIGLEAKDQVSVARYPRPTSFWRSALGRRLGGHATLRSSGDVAADVVTVVAANLVGELCYLAGERVWAVMPFHIRAR